MKFTLDKCDGHARRARLEFERGVVETPAFMPVGTYGTVKAMTPEELTRSRRPDHPRQHLSPDAAPRHRNHKAAWRPA